MNPRLKSSRRLSENNFVDGCETDVVTCMLHGAISPKQQILGNVADSCETGADICVLHGTITPKKQISGNVTYASYVDNYDGAYEVTPRATQQYLKTKFKQVLDDITVRAIPFYEESNSSGGTTVYIACEFGEE